MADVMASVIAKLKATSSLTSLVSTRIRAVRPRQDDTLPFVIATQISDVPDNAWTGSTGTREIRMQIDGLTSTYAGLKPLATAIETALKDWSDPSGTPSITSCHLTSSEEMDEGFEDGQDAGAFRVSQDYSIWFVG